MIPILNKLLNDGFNIYTQAIGDLIQDAREIISFICYRLLGLTMILPSLVKEN